MIANRIFCSGSFALLVAVLTNTTSAQVAPALGYAYPPAVQMGPPTQVQLGGFDFTDDMEIVSHDERLEFERLGPPGRFFVPEPPYWFGPKEFNTAFPIPREIPARISLKSGIRPGLKQWQVVNANGSSAAAVIYISDQKEIVEERIRDGAAQLLTELPVGVSGRIRKIAEVDRYQIRAERDGPISIELFARRLGANMNGVLEVHDDAGRMVADVADTEGVDAALTFLGQQGRTYTLSLHDADFRGNRAYVYRLAVTPGPRVIATIPAAGHCGESAELKFVGYGLATGAAEIESVTQSVSFPSDPNQLTLRYQLKTPHGAAATIEIPLSDQSESVEATRASGPLLISAPGAITGVLDDSDQDRFVWEAKKGETWNISVQSRAVGGSLDVALAIEDEAGKQLQANDDFGGSPDAALQFKAPKDGAYRCVIRDVSGRARNLLSVYRLALKRQTADFQLTTTQQVRIAHGGTLQLAIKAKRFAGMKEEIALSVEGLPDGVTTSKDLKIPAGKSDVKVPLSVAKDAATTVGMIRIRGECQIGEQTLVRYAEAPLGGNLCPRRADQKLTTKLLLNSQLTPPFTLELIDKNRQRPVHRGTTYPAPFLVKRKEGFEGAVVLQMAASQGRHRQGIRSPRITVPPGVEEVFYPCFMPEWLATDRTTRMAVVGVAKIPDAKGRLRAVTQSANARVTMILEGALLKLTLRPSELTVRPGEGFKVPLAVSRSSKLPESVRIELVPPAELRGLLEAQPVTLPLEQTQADLAVTSKADAKLRGSWKIKLKATAMQDGKWPVISETDVMVVFDPEGVDGD